MNTAYLDLIASLESLRSEAAGLPPVTGVLSVQARDAAQLRLNGLSVVAFSALEDFFKRRAFEIVSWLGTQGVIFDSFPKSLQQAILVGTVKGLSYSLEKTDSSDRHLLIQLEALLLSQAGESVGFAPSKYYFGHTTSNLSSGMIKELLTAFGYKEPDDAIDEIARQLSAQHLGHIMESFTRLAKLRHTSAHTFPPDYRVEGYANDVNINMPLLAACVDTCLSQLALLIKKNHTAGVAHNFSEAAFLNSQAVIRIAEYDKNEKCWKEYLRGKVIKSSSKSIFSSRLKQFEAGTLGTNDTVIIKNERGHVSHWIQPLR